MPIFKPTVIKKSITDISPLLLYELGILGLILDVDNTLAKSDDKQPVDGLDQWLEDMRQGGIDLIILSNNSARRVRPFAQSLGLRYISMAFKPLPPGYLRAIRAMGLERKRIAIVGDQIFTDVLGGNICGCKSILTEPVLLETKLSFRIRRRFERILLKKYRP